MNPSDTFESFDMNNFDDFLARESLEENEDANRSTGSSYSDTFDSMMPVYRSLDVMMPEDMLQLDSLSGLDKVFEPVLSRHSQSGTQTAITPVDDLFAQLSADCAHTSLPCQSHLLGGVVQTSVKVTSCLTSLSFSILLFLQARGVQHNHCEVTSLWTCELTDFVDSCKFQIQVYSSAEEEEGYVVEFLRVSGCSLLFSGEFQHFKTAHCPSRVIKSSTVISGPPVAGAVTTATAVGCVRAPSVVMPVLGAVDRALQSQLALESFVSWSQSDPAEAARAVCGLFSSSSSSSSSSTDSSTSNSTTSSDSCSVGVPPLLLATALSSSSSDQLSSEGILVMTLLGSMCLQFQQAAEDEQAREEAQQQEQEMMSGGVSNNASPAASSLSSSLPLLSLLHLLLHTRSQVRSNPPSPSSSAALLAVLSALIDSLLPAAIRLAQTSSSSSSCEKHSARRLVEMSFA